MRVTLEAYRDRTALGVPSGTYSVEVGSGDPDDPDQVFDIGLVELPAGFSFMAVAPLSVAQPGVLGRAILF